MVVVATSAYRGPSPSGRKHGCGGDAEGVALQAAAQRGAADALQRAIAADQAAIASIDQTVLPQATRALALAQDGYDRGGFTYLDVIEAQRALSVTRQARLESLNSYHNNEASLDRLTARFADALPGAEIHQ